MIGQRKRHHSSMRVFVRADVWYYDTLTRHWHTSVSCQAQFHLLTKCSFLSSFSMTVVSCGSLAPVAHALYDVPEETTYMTNITYDCEEGYKRGVGGDWTRTCLENKQWNGTPPVCLGQCVRA